MDFESAIAHSGVEGALARDHDGIFDSEQIGDVSLAQGRPYCVLHLQSRP